MPPFSLDLPDLSATAALGEFLGRIARPGDVITLTGELGAGKTALAQTIGRGLSVPASCYITSPTFSLLHEHPGRLPRYHMDLYRLSDETEIEELGFLEYLYGKGLSVIEWPERLGGLTPEVRLAIRLIRLDETGRRAEISAWGGDWQERIEAYPGLKPAGSSG